MTLKIKIGLIMFLAVIVIMATGFLSYRSLSLIVRSIDTETGPYLTSLKIKDIASELEKAENSVRMYSITREEKYLQPFYNFSRIEEKINRLKIENESDSLLTNIIDTISFLVEDKLLVLNDILILYENNNIEKKLQKIAKEIDSVSIKSNTDSNKINLIKRFFTRRRKLESDVSKHQQILKKIEIIQSEKDSAAVLIEQKELKLAKTSIQITTKLYDIITVLEINDALKQKQKAIEADKLSKETMSWIATFSIFGTLLALFGLFILTRYLRKSNAYQKALRESKKAAEDLVKAKEIFIANVSHELRTPMNVISGFTEQMVSSPENHHEYIKIIKASSDHLINLINELLDYSKLLAGKLELKPQHFLVSELVAELLAMFKIQALKTNVDLKAHLNENVPEVLFGDVFRLRQIIINLLSNAIKFSPNGKVDFTIDTRQIKGDALELVIIVADTGIGIDKDRVRDIFDDFTQEEADISRKYGGTGLGLSIVKKLVDLHQGEITVESSKQTGSVFTCILPYKIGNHSDIIPEHDQNEIPDLHGARILIVDDTEYNRKLLNVVLTKWGAEVHEAENGMDAIENIKRTNYDIIFLDIRMPVLDGYKTVKFIRQGMNKKSDELPIFITSAMSQEEEKKKYTGLGINDFITKPVSEKALIKVLQKSGKLKFIKTKKEDNKINNKINQPDGLDLTELNRLAGNDKKFVNMMLKKLVDLSDKEFINLENASQEKEWERIAEIAHKMASPYRHVGSGEILDYLKEIELNSRNEKNINTILEKIDLAKKKYFIIKSEIETFLSSAKV